MQELYCYPDTITLLEMPGLVQRRGAKFKLSKQAAAMLSNFVIADKHWTGTDLRIDYPQAFVIMPFNQISL